MNCKLIANYQILTDNLHLLIRNGSKSTIQEIKGIIFHNITSTHHIHNKINLMHHEEIIENKELKSTKTKKEEYEIETKETTNNLPNNDQYSDIIYQSSTINFIDEMTTKVEDLIINTAMTKGV